MLKTALSLIAISGVMAAAVPANAANVKVASCAEFASCYYTQTPEPFSATLSLNDLTAIGLGTTEYLSAIQTSPFIVRLGETSFTFTTSSGTVVDTLPEFSGVGSFNTQILNIGSIFIPNDALSLVISGTFGNSVVPNSAGADVYFGSVVSAVPLPASAPMFGAALLALGAAGISMKRRKAAA